MNFYHFSIQRYADSIREHGILSPAEKMRRGLYPSDYQLPPTMFAMENELVWLTRSPNAYAGVQRPELWNGIRRAAGWDDEGEFQPIRVEVAVEAKAWRTVHPKYGVPPRWMEALRLAGWKMSEFNSARDWYVVVTLIPPEKIVDIVAL